MCSRPMAACMKDGCLHQHSACPCQPTVAFSNLITHLSKSRACKDEDRCSLRVRGIHNIPGDHIARSTHFRPIDSLRRAINEAVESGR